MLLHAQMQRLESQIQQECVVRRRNAAKVAHELGDELGGIGHLSESLRIGESVIRLIGRAKAWELLGVGIPVEVSTIYDAATHLRGMTVHVFGCRMSDDISSPLERTAVDGRWERVVDDEGHAVTMGDASKLLDVEHTTTGIRDGLAKQSLRVRTEGGFDFFLAGFLVHECAVDAQFLQRHPEEIIGASIDFVGSHEVVASLADVEQSIEVGSLSAGREHSAHTPFESSNLAGHSIVGGILQAGVEIAFFLQIEEVGHLLGVIILERGALIDGEHACLSVFRFPASLHAKRGGFQFFLHVLFTY